MSARPDATLGTESHSVRSSPDATEDAMGGGTDPGCGGNVIADAGSGMLFAGNDNAGGHRAQGHREIEGACGVEINRADTQHAIDERLARIDVLHAVDVGGLLAPRKNSVADDQPVGRNRELLIEPREP